MNRTVVIVVLSLVALALAAVLVFGLVAYTTLDRAVAVPWPANLGPLTNAPKHFPATEANGDAATLRELLLDEEPPQAIMTFTVAETERGDGTTGTPPEELQVFLSEYESELDELREHLAGAGPIVWDHDPGDGLDAVSPPFHDLHYLGRALVARALVRRDADAWRDLHAAWKLVTALAVRPELEAYGVALSIARSVSAAAWRLPSPAPAWFAELQQLDFQRNILRALQYEAWKYWAHGKPPMNGPIVMIVQPLNWLSVAGMVRHQRETAAALLEVRGCAFDMDAFVAERRPSRWNFIAAASGASRGAFWDRSLRYRAEHEATLNVMRAAAGQPVVPGSRCEGTWSSEALPDGRTRILYSRELPPTTNDLAAPLMRITPARTPTPPT